MTTMMPRPEDGSTAEFQSQLEMNDTGRSRGLILPIDHFVMSENSRRWRWRSVRRRIRFIARSRGWCDRLRRTGVKRFRLGENRACRNTVKTERRPMMRRWEREARWEERHHERSAKPQLLVTEKSEESSQKWKTLFWLLHFTALIITIFIA